MRRAAAAVVLVVLGALLLLLREEARPRVARTGGPEGEAEKRAKPEGGGGAVASAAAKRAPPMLRGTVAGPNSMPLPRAQVAVRSPAGGEIVFSDGSGRYLLPLAGPGRHLVEASFGVELLPARKVVIAPAEGDPEEVPFQLLPPGLIRGEIAFHGEPLDRRSWTSGRGRSASGRPSRPSAPSRSTRRRRGGCRSSSGRGRSGRGRPGRSSRGRSSSPSRARRSISAASSCSPIRRSR